MLEEFEYNGKWWFPLLPDRIFSGILKYHPDTGARFEIMEPDKEIRDLFSFIEPDIILGKTLENKKITLYKCSRIGTEFYPEIIFINKHFEYQEAIKFNSLFVRFSYLKEWLNITPYKIERINRNKRKIIYNRLNIPFEVEIGGGYKISAFIKTDLIKESFNLEQSTYIRIISEEEKSFEEFEKVIHFIQYFLNFAINSSVILLVIEGIKDGHTVNIIYSLPHTILDVSQISKSEILFEYKDIKEKIDNFLSNWYEKSIKLKPIADLFLGTLWNPHIYLTNKFLNLMTALESYYTRTKGNLLLPKEVRKQIAKKIVKLVPKRIQIDYEETFQLKKLLKNKFSSKNEFKLRWWLKERIADSNRLSLNNKILNIMEDYSEILDDFFYDKIDFVERIVILRNYFTHFSAKSYERMKDEEKLPIFTDLLEIFVRICLLFEIGFKIKEIKEIILKNSHYRFSLFSWIIGRIIEKDDVIRFLDFLEKNVKWTSAIFFHLTAFLKEKGKFKLFMEKLRLILEEKTQWGNKFEYEQKVQLVGILVYLKIILGISSGSEEEKLVDKIIDMISTRFQLNLPLK